MSARERRARAEDTGFTLVELLVAMVMVTVLMTALLTMVLLSQRSAETTTGDHVRTEEARLALNRVGRELRQATAVDLVVNPVGTGHDPAAITAVTFRADFTGDGCIDGAPQPPATGPCADPYDPADPEVVSYCHEPAAVAAGPPRLYILAGALTAPVTSCTGGEAILAEAVTAFSLEYRSSEYRWDTDADGSTSWEELDAALPPVGDQDGVLDVELAEVDSIVVRLELGDGPGRDFQTQLALRNRT